MARERVGNLQMSNEMFENYSPFVFGIKEGFFALIVGNELTNKHRAIQTSETARW